MTSSVLLSELLGLPVRIGSLRAGEVTGVFVDQRAHRAIGLEVVGPRGTYHFLPWVAATFGGAAVFLDSSLLLVDDGSSYERLGAKSMRDPIDLSALRAIPDGTVGRRAVAAGTVSELPLVGTPSR